MIKQETIRIDTRGRGTYNFTRQVEDIVRGSNIRTGLCHIFVHHTSASLMLCENADPTVRRDLEVFLSDLVPDGDPRYQHTQEGADDMPAHVRAILTNMELTVPVTGGRCALGTWQGIYLYEHRTHSHQRRVTVTVNGE